MSRLTASSADPRAAVGRFRGVDLRGRGLAVAVWERDNPGECGRSVAVAFTDGVTGMTTPTMTWTRLTRRLGSDHNPLRRRSDLMDAWLLPAAIVVFVLLGPLVAAAAIWWMHGDNAALRQSERSWRPVPAVLLQAAPGPLMSDQGANTWLTWEPAKWTAAGTQRTGEIPAAAGTSAGSTVPVWLDRAGHVRTPPLTGTQASDRVLVAVSVALAALAVLLTGLVLLARYVLNRRRIASWEADWLSVGPQWTPHG
jgi:hypothetical protein